MTSIKQSKNIIPDLIFRPGRKIHQTEALLQGVVLPSKFLFALLIIFSFAVPATLFAASVSAGVPTELIWFSKDPFVESDQITIFAPLYNRSTYRFQGTLTLRDGDVTLGVRQFVLAAGSSEIFAFPWLVTRGEHSFSVLISGGEFVSVGKNTVDLPIAEGTAQAVKRFVESKPIPLASSSAPETATPSQGANVTDYLSTKIPDALRDDALPVVGRIEDFRLNQATRAEAVATGIIAGLPVSQDASTDSSAWGVWRAGVVSGEIIHTPWEYVKLFFVLCYQFLTGNIYVFYIFCSYVIYLLVRLILSVAF